MNVKYGEGRVRRAVGNLPARQVIAGEMGGTDHLIVWADEAALVQRVAKMSAMVGEGVEFVAPLHDREVQLLVRDGADLALGKVLDPAGADVTVGHTTAS